jgi:hypothetical protein
MASTHKSTTNGLPKMAREADLSKAHQHIHTFSLSCALSLALMRTRSHFHVRNLSPSCARSSSVSGLQIMAKVVDLNKTSHGCESFFWDFCYSIVGPAREERPVS